MVEGRNGKVFATVETRLGMFGMLTEVKGGQGRDVGEDGDGEFAGICEESQVE